MPRNVRKHRCQLGNRTDWKLTTMDMSSSGFTGQSLWPESFQAQVSLERSPGKPALIITRGLRCGLAFQQPLIKETSATATNTASVFLALLAPQGTVWGEGQVCSTEFWANNPLSGCIPFSFLATPHGTHMALMKCWRSHPAKCVCVCGSACKTGQAAGRPQAPAGASPPNGAGPCELLWPGCL